MNNITQIIAANITSGRLNARDLLTYLNFLNTTPALSKVELATIKRLVIHNINQLEVTK